MTREAIDRELERLAQEWDIVLYAVFPNQYPRVTSAYPTDLAAFEREIVPPHRQGYEPCEVEK